ncbi:MAG: NAD(P)/FAD-dependent oxidoreductase [Gammaproteobacteria bacterium]|jgi:cyclohexanone monooxygenase|nr:NAD(P)/FAD-dependent oxidoreductase [Gammaproteobacteria bacterium]MBT5205428.1 NAD(P)/FAD-dependent oxidoreductase [Gammaproteobacteria bacterium]MBT5601306.1 NAD(P)/FAD-dependent oxidoreductase [Gammaproteobacteria bacterium]MBT6244981.1 NAD(P)/FAD-dependent oxidoreductase [Gammaproteobacteria bacterium]
MSINSEECFDVVIVGAGFAGLYMLHRLRGLGLTARIYEQGDDVGGTWYWNRYPGARCDAESLAYSFGFSEELEQEWQWSERYSRQPEILQYAKHVAERFDLLRDIHFGCRVNSVEWNEQRRRWSVTTEQGDRVTGQYCIMATGCLSVPQLPAIEGLDSFAGNRYQASQWPHQEVTFSSQRVGIIGTGSSAIQAIPVIAESAGKLTVFQRTPNFSVPAKNNLLNRDWVNQFKSNYRAHRENHQKGIGSGFGDLDIEPLAEAREPILMDSIDSGQAEQLLQAAWTRGGAIFLGAIGDTMMNESTNQFVQKFVHDKIRTIVNDPETATSLCPGNHPIGTRRICVDIDYFETYNRANVRLLDLRKSPISKITATGVETASEFVELDTLVLATGFDAMTGALLGMDIIGQDGVQLRDAWAEGPKSYLGLSVNGFPNLFTITGPGSPSVLSNMLVSIEQHVDWITGCITYMGDNGFTSICADQSAQEQWVGHVNDVANGTLFPKGGSWYLGANVKGKPRVFMPYAAGVGPYREICDQIAEAGYRGFRFSA